jgi:hypothetical protein
MTISSPVAQEIIKSHYYVECSVTGKEIPLTELLYWNVELQKPYLSPEYVVHADFYPHLAIDGLENTTSYP